jgi:1-acyl-sn-glycerol-3-phosphate acyltransferase
VRTPVLDLFRPSFHRLCRAYFGLQLRGIEHIPATGPVIITPNHQSYADPPLVTIPVRRRIYYMAWSRLFEIHGLSWLIRRLRAFPVQIDTRDPRATREAARLLQSGAALMIFPEGERTEDGSLRPFKLGAFRLAVMRSAPVLPVTIDGAFRAWPRGRVVPSRGQVSITYHPVLMPGADRDQRKAAQELSERTRAVIASALPLTLAPGPGAAEAAARPRQR